MASPLVKWVIIYLLFEHPWSRVPLIKIGSLNAWDMDSLKAHRPNHRSAHLLITIVYVLMLRAFNYWCFICFLILQSKLLGILIFSLIYLTSILCSPLYINGMIIGVIISRSFDPNRAYPWVYDMQVILYIHLSFILLRQILIIKLLWFDQALMLKPF